MAPPTKRSHCHRCLSDSTHKMETQLKSGERPVLENEALCRVTDPSTRRVVFRHKPPTTTTYEQRPTTLWFSVCVHVHTYMQSWICTYTYIYISVYNYILYMVYVCVYRERGETVGNGRKHDQAKTCPTRISLKKKNISAQRSFFLKVQRCPRGNGWKQSEIAPSLGKKVVVL